MGEKQLIHVFIKASVSELKIRSVAGRYRKLMREMGLNRSTGSSSLVNIDLSALLLHLQMFYGQLTFDNTYIGSCALLVATGRVS